MLRVGEVEDAFENRRVHATWVRCLVSCNRKTGDEAAIRANVAAYETSWNKRDASGVVATYTPDADVVVLDSDLPPI